MSDTRSEPYGQFGRLLAIVVLVGVLAGLPIWYGATVADERTADRLPTESEFGPATNEYVGDRVAATGTIIETDPVVMEVEYGDDGTMTLVLEEYVAPAEAGSYELVTGTLVDESTIVLVGSETGAPWESYYMYAVSAIALLWVAGRVGRQWRFDRQQIAFVPKSVSQADTTHRTERHSSTEATSVPEGDDA